MQHRLVAVAVIAAEHVEGVLLESAVVREAPVREDARPLEGLRLSAVVKAAPDEDARDLRRAFQRFHRVLQRIPEKRRGQAIAVVDLLFFVVAVDAAGRVQRAVLGADHRMAGAPLRVRVVVFYEVVHAGDVQHVGGVLLRQDPSVHRSRDRAGVILFPDPAEHLLSHTAASRFRLPGLFVEEAVEEDARVVAAGPRQRVELLHDFVRAAVVAVLRHDEHAHLVADGEEVLRRAVVRAAEGVAAHCPEFADAVAQEGARDGDPDAGVVLVAADAADGRLFPIDEHPVVRPLDLAEADRGAGFL